MPCWISGFKNLFATEKHLFRYRQITNNTLWIKINWVQYIFILQWILKPCPTGALFCFDVRKYKVEKLNNLQLQKQNMHRVAGHKSSERSDDMFHNFILADQLCFEDKADLLRSNKLHGKTKQETEALRWAKWNKEKKNIIRGRNTM